ncbi:hypothetical protein HanRHA438_Chr07g0289661 [Helianthus annuus]|nr:hypothetical protein HanRHA438_Chr07g0289661 [Helianthus annuus]
MPLISTVETSGPLPVPTIVSSLMVSLIPIHGARLVSIIGTVSITSPVSLWAVPITTTVIPIPRSSLASPASTSPTKILRMTSLPT